MHAWKANDAVLIEYDGEHVPGIVILASPNSKSLMLGFEAILDGHVGQMPVLLDDDGAYRAIITNTVVILKPYERTD